MVKYSDMAEVVWTLNQYTYAYDMEVALSALQHLGGNTNTADALQKTREEIYMMSQGGNRTDARDVIVLMTDGLSTRRQHDVKVRGAECRAYYVTLSAKSSLILGENKTFCRECLINYVFTTRRKWGVWSIADWEYSCNTPFLSILYNNFIKSLNCAFIWVVKIRNNSEAVLRPQYAPRPYTDQCPEGRCQYDVQGAYCGPHTASSVFLILI